MNKKILGYIICIISIITLSISIINVYKWYKDNKNTKSVISNLDVNINKTTKEVEFINPPDNLNDSYYNYQDIDFLRIDFKDLIDKNNDTVGYIKLNGTNIDYPIVKSIDNNYYLTHSFDKSVNDAGWIFLDYKNNLNELSKNTVIYGHRRTDMSMFGSLKNLFKDDWFNNKENHIIKLSTPKENTLWQIVSVYKVYKETYYLTTYFNNDKEYNGFLDRIRARSIYDFNTSLDTNDYILTLSSCYNSNGLRMVVHAKLVRRELNT